MMKKTLIGLGIVAIISGGFLTANALTCTNVFPTVLNGYTSSSCIASSWANALETKLGITHSAVTSSLDYQINHIFTSYGSEIVTTTALTNVPLLSRNGSDYVSSTFRSNLGLGDSALLASSTWAKVINNLSDLQSTSTARNNLGLGPFSTQSTPCSVSQGCTGTTTYVSGLVFASGTDAFFTMTTSSLGLSGGAQSSSKFGGDGTDGAFSSSGLTVTTISIGSAPILVKNYTSISITGTSSLAFSNPSSNGSIIVLKSQGNCTLTSASTTMIDLRNLGGIGGTGVGQSGTGAGSGGGGGSSAFLPGSAGTTGSGTGSVGSDGSGYGGWLFGTAQTGGKAGNAGSGSTGGLSPQFVSSSIPYVKLMVIPGSGGGAGQSSNSGGTSPSGSRGAGALYIECAGSLNFTGTINASSSQGGLSTGADGAAGGGGGGSVVIIYNTLTANTGTINVQGGAGGTSSSTGLPGGAGANGYGIVVKNTEF